MNDTNVNKVLHQPNASMVSKSQVANIMQMLSEETQVQIPGDVTDKAMDIY
jgi:hypothetical protein